MKTAISILKYILFWMIIFTIQRLLFFVFHFQQIQEAPFTEQIWIFVKGLRLDISMTGYFLLIPIVLLILQLFAPKKSAGFDTFIAVYTYILLVIVLLFGIIDLSIYKEWGAKLNSRAIEFLLFSPGEALASSTSSPIYLSAFILISQLIIFIYGYRKYFRFECDLKLHFILKLISIPLYAFIAVLMMRGGLQLAPINQSAVYFSKYSIINHASLNTEWNLMHSVIENHFSNENPYVFMESTKADQLVDSLYSNTPEDSVQILNTTRPNVVYIILESFTSDVVEHFGGEKDVCPNLNRMAQEGLSFTNIYASGDRTDKGMIAVLSSFPTQAVRTIIQQPDKFEKLPSLTKTLSNLGYTTSFFYGGESEFANFKSYLVSSGIEKIVDKRDFESSQMNSKWGAHDGFLFDKALTDLSKQKEPFISILLTLSSHEPFEIPVPSPYKGDDLPSKFRKAAHYTDQCIADFMEGAKKQAWYKNTLFIIVADHGHRLPKEYEKAYDIRKFRIPLIMYGDVINKNYLHRNITKVGSQTDINKTLLTQMQVSDTAFVWSSDLLNSKPGFAFYTYDNGIGWVDDKQWLTMDNFTKSITSKGGDSTLEQQRLKVGKAYMQRVFSRYLLY
jgi:phosphoglycerol transferase MdoB-like AlkP superfamily enzyme